MHEWVLPMTSMLYAASELTLRLYPLGPERILTCTSVIAAMRVYAIGDRNRFLALWTFSLGLAPVVLHIAA